MPQYDDLENKVFALAQRNGEMDQKMIQALNILKDNSGIQNIDLDIKNEVEKIPYFYSDFSITLSSDKTSGYTDSYVYNDLLSDQVDSDAYNWKSRGFIFGTSGLTNSLSDSYYTVTYSENGIDTVYKWISDSNFNITTYNDDIKILLPNGCILVVYVASIIQFTGGKWTNGRLSYKLHLPWDSVVRNCDTGRIKLFDACKAGQTIDVTSHFSENTVLSDLSITFYPNDTLTVNDVPTYEVSGPKYETMLGTLEQIDDKIYFTATPIDDSNWPTVDGETILTNFDLSISNFNNDYKNLDLKPLFSHIGGKIVDVVSNNEFETVPFVSETNDTGIAVDYFAWYSTFEDLNNRTNELPLNVNISDDGTAEIYKVNSGFPVYFYIECYKLINGNPSDNTCYSPGDIDDETPSSKINFSIQQLTSTDGVTLYGRDANTWELTGHIIKLFGEEIIDDYENWGISLKVIRYKTTKALQLEASANSTIDMSSFVYSENNKIMTNKKYFSEGPYGLSSIDNNNAEITENDVYKYTIDLSNGTVFHKRILGDTEFEFIGVPENNLNQGIIVAATFNLILEDTVDGEYELTWPDNVHWSNDVVPTLTAGGTDILTFITPNGGIDWYGSLSIVNTVAPTYTNITQPSSGEIH